METLSAENRAMLEMYKKERPDIFARLPLPKKLAEEMGVPISSETVHLMTYMKNHMAIVSGQHVDAYEEKVSGYVTDMSGNIKPDRHVDKTGEFFEGIDQAKMRDRAHGAYFKHVNSALLDSKIESFPYVSQGGTNAAAVPQ